MKVVCTEKMDGFNPVALMQITIGKIYEVEITTIIGNLVKYSIINDMGYKYTYPKSMFITLEDYREGRIDKILE